MENLYIDLKEQNKWIQEQFDWIDLISINDLLSKFEDLIFENEKLKETIEELENEKENENPEYADKLYEIKKMGVL